MVMLVTAAGNTAMQSVMPAIGTQLGVADYWVSLAYSWSALLWVITAPRWARLSDKRGRKALMHIGLAGFVSSFLFCGLVLWAGLHGMMSGVVTLLIFAAFRSLYGGFGSAAPPAVQAYVASRTSREQRTSAMSLIASSFGLGTVIGPAIAPLIIIPFIGLPSPFLIFGLFGIAVAIALKIILPGDDPRYQARGTIISEPHSSGGGLDFGQKSDKHDDYHDEAVNENDPADNMVPMRGADDAPVSDEFGASEKQLKWTDARIRPWLIIGLAGGHANAVILGVIGFLLLDRLGLRATPELAAEPTGMVLMSGAFATLLAQWGLIPTLKMSPRSATIWGCFLGALGVFMVSLSSSLMAITLGFALAALGFGLFRPGFTSGSSLAVSPEEQGQVAGIVASVNGAAYIFAPALGVYLYTIAPMAGFALTISLALIALVLAVTKLDKNAALQ